ncbi:MAG: hypothetical protein ACJAZ3_001976 [Sphingobacteriales bacterium]|jgi:hypothetical protein
MNIQSSLLAMFTTIILLSSCAPDTDSLLKPKFSTNYLVPLAFGTLDVYDIVENDSVIVITADQSLSIIEDRPLFELKLDSLVSLDSVRFTINSGFSKISLNSVVRGIEYSLGEAVSNSPTAATYNSQHGTTPYFYLGVATETETPDRLINIGNIDSVVFATGQLIVSAISAMDIDVATPELRFYDKGGVKLLSSFPLTALAVMGTAVDTIALNGALLHGDVVARIAFTSAPVASAGAAADTSQSLNYTFMFRELIPQSGQFEIPTQTVETNFSGGVVGLLPDIRLADMTFIDGRINVKMNNNFDFKINSVLNIPSIINGASILGYNQDGRSNSSRDVALAGNRIDFTGPNSDTVNLFYGTAIVTIPTNTARVPYNKVGTSLDIEFSFKSPELDRAKGNFGTRTISGVEVNEVFNALIYERIKGGDIEFETAQVQFKITSTAGLNGSLDYESKSKNGVNGNEVVLNPTPKQVILPALENPLRNNPANDDGKLDQNNSNVLEYISNTPITFESDYTFIMNPNNDPNDLEQFLYPSSSITGNMIFNVPIAVKFNDFTFSDTINADLTALPSGDSSITSDFGEFKFKRGILTFRFINGFGYDFKFRIVSVDEGGNQLDTLINAETNGFVMAAELDENDKVSKNIKTEVQFVVNEEEYELLTQTKKFYVDIILDNDTYKRHIKIYSGYEIDIRIILDASFDIQVDTNL